MSAKSPARPPPTTITINPTADLALARTPQSINIDLEDLDEETKKDPLLASQCIVAAPSLEAAVEGSSTALAGYCWFQCPQGLLACAARLGGGAHHNNNSCTGASSFASLEPALATRLGSLAELSAALLPSASASASASSPIVFLALSNVSYRVYRVEGGGGGGEGGPSACAAEGAGGLAASTTDGGDVSPCTPSRGGAAPRGSTKDKITSAVAFDFVSGIMKGVVGGDVDALYMYGDATQ